MTFPCLWLLVSPLMRTLPALRLPSAPASFPALCSNTFAPWQQQQKFVQALPIYPLCSWLWTVLYSCPTLLSLDSWLSAGNPALFTPRIPSPGCCSVAWSGVLVEDRGEAGPALIPLELGRRVLFLRTKGCWWRGSLRAEGRRWAVGGRAGALRGTAGSCSQGSGGSRSRPRLSLTCPQLCREKQGALSPPPARALSAARRSP